jgi:prophage regulatory protein
MAQQTLQPTLEYSMPTFLHYPDIKSIGIKYSDASLRRLEAAGQFPKRIRIGPRRIAWRKADIDQYIAACVAGRT